MDHLATTLVEDLAARCRPAGIDLVHPLRADWYDAAVATEHRLPDPGRRGALAVLLASTRAFWGPFVARLAAEPGRLEHADPLDRYVEDAVTCALDGVRVPYEIRFSHEPPPRRVAMQRLAHVSGLAPLAPGMLSVHPVYGPWIGLRAVVVFDADGPAGEAPAVALACDGCAAGCAPALEHAMRPAAGTAAGADPVRGSWRTWLAVRDACPVGREHRYPEAMIRYVYTKDRDVLRAAARAGGAAGEGWRPGTMPGGAR